MTADTGKGRCLVLGGCGFLGSYAAEALLQAGHPVRVFDRVHVDTMNLASFINRVELFSGDLTSQSDVEAALESVDYVFHFASTTIPKTATEDPVFDLESNVGGVLRILEAARRRSVRKIVYCSSGGGVYGIPRELPITEDHPTNPLSAYGVSKLSIETYLKLYQYLYGLPYVVLRLSNPYGPRQNVHNPQGAVTHFLHSVLNDKPIEIWGDGSVVRDYFFARDLLPLFPKMIGAAADNRVYNIGRGEGHSLNEVVTAIGEVLGRKPRVIYAEGRKIDVPVNVLSIDRVRRELGWSAGTALEAGILETWRWLEAADREGRRP